MIWEILNGCQEAAFADIPNKYRHYLSIFNIKDNCFEEIRSTQKVGRRDIFAVKDVTYTPFRKPLTMEDMRHSLRLQVRLRRGMIPQSIPPHAILTSYMRPSLEPWTLPNPVRPLSHEDALWRENVRVLEVSQVHPTAAIYLALDHVAMGDINCPEGTCNDEPPLITRRTFEKSMSPLVHATAPRFASAVFISASHTFPHSKNISFQSIRRYSRLATTSLLRQTHALHIDAPVFGILLRGNLVAIHVDWYEENNGIVVGFWQYAFHQVYTSFSGVFFCFLPT